MSNITTATAAASLTAMEAKAGLTDIALFEAFSWESEGQPLYEIRAKRSDSDKYNEDTFTADDIARLQIQERTARVERMAALVAMAEADETPLAELLPEAHYLR